jgi:hypothetical protein
MRTPIALILTILLSATVALAEDDQKKAEAEKYFRAGETAYNVGNYLAATQAFENAYELLPVPAIAFSTAQAYRLLYVKDKQAGYVKRAVELYKIYIDQVGQGGRVPDATANLAELEKELRALEAAGQSTAMPIMAPVTQLMINSQTPGARATVDGKTGPLPLIVDVAPGEHTVAAEADGYFPNQTKAVAVEGQFIVHEVDFQPMPAVLKIRAESGARVEVDGRPVKALRGGIEVPAGRHFVTVTRRGRHAFSREVDAKRGETVELDARLRKTGQRKAVPWVWIGAGVLALGAGAAGGLALYEQGQAEEIDARRETVGITAAERDQYYQHRDRRDQMVNTMWGLGGAALITATVGALMYVFDRPDAEAPPPSFGPTESAPAVTPFATDGGAGVSVTGSF